MHYGDVDHVGGHDHAGAGDEEDRHSLILSSIERFGCHIPKCVARSLEDNPLEGMEGKDYYCNINGSTNKNNHNNNNKQNHARNSLVGAGGGRRGSMGRRLSWSSASTGMSSNWANSSLSSPGGGGGNKSATDLNYPGGISEGSNSSIRTAEISNIFPLPMPNSNLHHQSALLLVDISGFTKLSTLLDVESLSKAINNYFELLLREVEIYDGDILKFAGDAFYAEWIGEDVEDLEDAITKATLCAASIVKKYSGYMAHGLHQKTGKEETATLDVHCGVGVGDIAIIHVGNHESRREFLVLGDPIDQVSKAEGFATLGELAASPEAIRMLQNVCQISDEIDVESSNEPQVLAFRDKQWFTQDDFTDEDLWMHPQPYRPAYVSPNTIEALQYQMSLYVHPTARGDELMGVDHHSRRNIANAELRNVYTIFVKPLINPKITGDRDEDANLFAQLNDIMCVTNRVLDRFKGHLRQFIVDDKGVVLIATFGQRGATFPNMVTEKGLPATIAIFDALKIELDVNCHIGATIGRAYCGVVGGERRHEFAVLGPSVNLAARLMSSKNNPGILVDDAVRMMASKRFDFVSHPPVKAKGYPELVPIFEPHSAIERQWNKIKDFVGREKEMGQLIRIARDYIRRRSIQIKPHVVLIQAHSGLGKSSLVMQVMEQIRRLGNIYSKKHIVVKKNVCKDGEERVPFSVFRQIILDLLSDYGGEDIDDNASQGSESSLSLDGLEDDSTGNSDRLHLERLRALCKDLNHNEEFADVIAVNMLGLHTTCGLLGQPKRKDVKPNDVMDFVADAFIKCTAGSDFTLLALDDVHWMDSLSWKVVQCLYERGENLMILCNSRPLASNNLSIDPDFLQNLRSESTTSQKPRFTEILLQPFTKADIRDLLATSLECIPSSIDETLCNSMYEQSGGMPYFAQELVRNLIRNDLLETRQDGTAGLRKELSEDVKFLYSNINDLLLHRLDYLDSNARTLLQVCAVLGFEFSLSELIMVQCKGRRRTASQIKKIQDGLNTAVSERILMEVFKGGSNRKVADCSQNRRNSEPIETNERSYTFTHAIWRKCVLGTMLKERERDLHRIVASLLEGSGFEKVVEPISALKIFRHWRACGNFINASSIALKITAYFETLNLHRQAVELYLDTVNMWKELSDDIDTDMVAVPSWKLLNKLIPDELDCVARLYLALAKSHVNLNESKTAALLFQTCDAILSKAPASEYLKDRTIYFSVFSGLFIVIKGGHITDPKNIYEQDLAMRFVEQAKIHGDPVHITRALAMQSLLLGGLGKFEEALEAQHRVEELYDAETLSDGIVRAYASDRVAQNYGYSVLWYEVLGRYEESEKQIDFILHELMPKMPEKNVHNSIMIILPVLWVLVDKGQARKAEETFRILVYDKFYEFYGKDGSTTYFKFIYKPLNMVLRLAGDAQEGEKLEPELYSDMEDWVLSNEVGTFKAFDVTSMCNLGRDPHSVISEICWWLAVADKSGERHTDLLEKGISQALKSKEVTQGKKGFEYARRQGEKIFKRFI